MSRGFLLNDRRDAFCRKELFGLFAPGYFMSASGFLVLEFDTYMLLDKVHLRVAVGARSRVGLTLRVLSVACL